MVPTQISLNSEEATSLEQLPDITKYFANAKVNSDKSLQLIFNHIEDILEFLCYLSQFGNDLEYETTHPIISSIEEKIWTATKTWLKCDYGQLLLDCAEESGLIKQMS